MDRRAFITSFGFLLLAAPLPARAQQAGKLSRIGFLGQGATDAVGRLRLETFRQGLRERGWIEGQNIVIEYRSAEGRLDQLPDLAAELVRLKVDVIYAPSTAATIAAQNATKTIPIVMTLVPDPVGRGIIASLARPGGNVTGLSYGVDWGLIGKRLELLKEIVPKVSRVAVLGDPGESYHGPAVREAEMAGRSLGVQLQVLEARGPNEFDSAFGAMVRQRAGALLVFSSPKFSRNIKLLVDLAAKNRLPAIYSYTEYVDAGGLVAYGPNFSDLLRRAATYVDKILKGAKPADLPVEQPTQFELVINAKTAKVLGLTIPPSVLLRADQVIDQ
jgi:putative ABC transport system substrate-binding protein